jgi:hypothetical protein
LDLHERKLHCQHAYEYDIRYDMIYLLTAIGLTPGGSSAVHIYTQTIHRTIQSTHTIHRTTQLTWYSIIHYELQNYTFSGPNCSSVSPSVLN